MKSPYLVLEHSAFNADTQAILTALLGELHRKGYAFIAHSIHAEHNSPQTLIVTVIGIRKDY